MVELQDDFSADDQIGRPTLFHRYLRLSDILHRCFFVLQSGFRQEQHTRKELLEG